MEGSWGVESLDSLWFFGNVLSRARPSPSAAEAEETDEKGGGGGGGGEPVKNQADGPEDEAGAARAKPVAQSGENSLPRCPWCGNLDAGAAELSLGGMKSSAVEAGGTPESAEEESTLKERMRRSKRRQRSRRTFRGELDLGCDGKDLSGFEENHFLWNYRQGFGAASEIQAMKKKMLPPLSDGVAMREHLRSWAVAVACAVK
ncbi:hypothetical protein NL676_008384 [Syzygium grande]|nr:hypothetical protein NL676_008384 [Syzygium grande]